MPAPLTGTGSFARPRHDQARPGGPSAREGHQEINGKMGWHERTV
jgi:hypothetical protein